MHSGQLATRYRVLRALLALSASAVLQFFLRWRASSFSGVQETSDGYLLTAMASILLSSFKTSQLTHVHNYKLQAFLSMPVYFSFPRLSNEKVKRSEKNEPRGLELTLYKGYRLGSHINRREKQNWRTARNNTIYLQFQFL